MAKLDRGKMRLAETISFVTNPVILLVAATSFIIYRYADSLVEFIKWLIAALGLLVVPGALYSAVIWAKERRLDLDITDRQDRILPLALSTLGAVIGVYLVSARVESSRLLFMGNVLLAFLICLTIITLIWKISLHAATMAAMVTILVLFYGLIFVWLYLLLIPIIWARLVLRQHNVAQLSAGVLLGALLPLIAYKLFGG
jgi:hypothetical protein